MQFMNSAKNFYKKYQVFSSITAYRIAVWVQIVSIFAVLLQFLDSLYISCACVEFINKGIDHSQEDMGLDTTGNTFDL